jgi:hypothetical protein
MRKGPAKWQSVDTLSPHHGGADLMVTAQDRGKSFDLAH